MRTVFNELLPDEAAHAYNAELRRLARRDGVDVWNLRTAMAKRENWRYQNVSSAMFGEHTAIAFTCPVPGGQMVYPVAVRISEGEVAAAFAKRWPE